MPGVLLNNIYELLIRTTTSLRVSFLLSLYGWPGMEYTRNLKIQGMRIKILNFKFFCFSVSVFPLSFPNEQKSSNATTLTFEMVTKKFIKKYS